MRCDVTNKRGPSTALRMTSLFLLVPSGKSNTPAPHISPSFRFRFCCVAASIPRVSVLIQGFFSLAPAAAVISFSASFPAQQSLLVSLAPAMPQSRLTIVPGLAFGFEPVTESPEPSPKFRWDHGAGLLQWKPYLRSDLQGRQSGQMFPPSRPRIFQELASGY